MQCMQLCKQQYIKDFLLFSIIPFFTIISFVSLMLKSRGGLFSTMISVLLLLSLSLTLAEEGCRSFAPQLSYPPKCVGPCTGGLTYNGMVFSKRNSTQDNPNVLRFLARPQATVGTGDCHCVAPDAWTLASNFDFYNQNLYQ